MSDYRIEESARIIGKIRLGKKVYIAQGSVLRSIEDSIKIGNNSGVLENSVVIGTPESPVAIGSKTVLGHKCICVGAEIGDLCEIGNGTILLPDSKIGDRCILGEGTTIPSGIVIPDESVVVGRPGRVIRSLSIEDMEMLLRMRNQDITLSTVMENIIIQEAKEETPMGKTYSYNGKNPVIDETAFIFDSAEITGDVIIGKNTIIASGVKIIGDSHGPVRIGDNVQILENTVLHLLPDNQLIIDNNVTIGAGCIIHGATIGENTIIESAAIVCDYSVLGKNILVKAGSLVKQRSIIPDHHIIEGFPAKTIGQDATMKERPAWAFKDLEK